MIALSGSGHVKRRGRSSRILEAHIFKRPSPKPTISGIADPRIRGLLRGLLSKDLSTSTLQTLNRLRRTANFRDWQRVSEILLLNPLFSHLPFPAPFPAKPVNPSQNYSLETQSLANELLHQSARLYIAETTIGHQARKFAEINGLIFSRSYEQAISSLLEAEHIFG